jgi:hypothetical protein
LPNPVAIANSGSNLFVTDSYYNSIGEYTTPGGTGNPSLITGLSGPVGIALSGSNLVVVGSVIGTISE